MQLHQLKPIHKKKKRKRVGRGGKRGTYSGKGVKGQRSRAGKKFQPVIRELIKRYPKLRGYRFKSFRLKPTIINLDALEMKFKTGDTITPYTLIEKRIISKIKGRLPQVKILGKGKLEKSLTVRNCLVSSKAKEKIEKAGGVIRI
ncbi:50S ribosomal protein L15 [Patescibacteria group bacterium]|nr:50S ribosomal protein L15 [Patescibacteria group bacterium]